MSSPTAPDPMAAELLSMRVELSSTRRSPRAARRLVAEVLTAWQMESVISRAQYVVSEIVSNAVEQVVVDTTLVLELIQQPGRLRMQLTSGRAHRPIPCAVHDLSMHMIDAIAEHWGTAQQPSSKRIWLDLTTSMIDEPCL